MLYATQFSKTLKTSHHPRPHNTYAVWIVWDHSLTGLGSAVRYTWARTLALPPTCDVTLSKCSPLSASRHPHFTMWEPRKCQMPAHPEPSRPPQHPGTGHTPVMRTSAERQAKAGTSTTKLCRDREKARMLSIQLPKPRAHCRWCSTRPEQKMSFPSAGLDLAGRDADGGQRGWRAGQQDSRGGAGGQWAAHR